MKSLIGMALCALALPLTASANTLSLVLNEDDSTRLDFVLDWGPVWGLNGAEEVNGVLQTSLHQPITGAEISAVDQQDKVIIVTPFGATFPTQVFIDFHDPGQRSFADITSFFTSANSPAVYGYNVPGDPYAARLVYGQPLPGLSGILATVGSPYTEGGYGVPNVPGGGSPDLGVPDRADDSPFNVPDGGSTFALCCGALAGLGLIARKR